MGLWIILIKDLSLIIIWLKWSISINSFLMCT